jgi:hypothetical protein
LIAVLVRTGFNAVFISSASVEVVRARCGIVAREILSLEDNGRTVSPVKIVSRDLKLSAVRQIDTAVVVPFDPVACDSDSGADHIAVDPRAVITEYYAVSDPTVHPRM